MAQQIDRWMFLSQVIVQRVTLVCFCRLPLPGPPGSLAAAVGLAPWLRLDVGLGGVSTDAGPAIQFGLTLFLLGLCFFVPMNDRVMRLETSHRSFRVTMWDVAQAYQAAHAADRDGCFSLKSEFDSVRERLEHLRRHPDLGTLEPELLEIAAQMSHESRELGEIYSTERVERAKQFLQQRQEEADQMTAAGAGGVRDLPRAQGLAGSGRVRGGSCPIRTCAVQGGTGAAALRPRARAGRSAGLQCRGFQPADLRGRVGQAALSAALTSRSTRPAPHEVFSAQPVGATRAEVRPRAMRAGADVRTSCRPPRAACVRQGSPCPRRRRSAVASRTPSARPPRSQSRCRSSAGCGHRGSAARAAVDDVHVGVSSSRSGPFGERPSRGQSCYASAGQAAGRAE